MIVCSLVYMTSFILILAGKFVSAQYSSGSRKVSLCTKSTAVAVPIASGFNRSTEFQLQCAHPGDRLVIEWSHYGVYTSESEKTALQRTNSIRRVNRVDEKRHQLKKTDQSILNELECLPDPNDCVMDHTEKVAELCTGYQECLISKQPQFVHKCSKYSNYLYIAYQCIPAESTEFICSSANLIADDVFLLSPDFPKDYPSNQRCECHLASADPHSVIELTSMLFSTQDDVDSLSIEHSTGGSILKYSGSLPIHTLLSYSDSAISVSFQSDKSVASTGFVLVAKALDSCPDGYDGIGDKCLRYFPKATNWYDSEKLCESFGDQLLEWPVDTKQSKYTLDWLSKLDVEDVWINKFNSLSKHRFNSKEYQDWFSFRMPTLRAGKCLIHNIKKGFSACSCQRNASTVCVQSRSSQRYPITLQCNAYFDDNSASDHSILDVHSRQGRVASRAWISQQQKRLAVVQGCLFWLLCTCIALVSLNLIICLTCYRKVLETPKTPSEILELQKWVPNSLLTSTRDDNTTSKLCQHCSLGYHQIGKQMPSCSHCCCIRQCKGAQIPYDSFMNSTPKTMLINTSGQHFYEQVLAAATVSKYSGSVKTLDLYNVPSFEATNTPCADHQFTCDPRRDPSSSLSFNREGLNNDGTTQSHYCTCTCHQYASALPTQSNNAEHCELQNDRSIRSLLRLPMLFHRSHNASSKISAESGYSTNHR